LLLLLVIAATVVGVLLTPKPKFNQPQPSALGDFQFPTATEGRAIPMIGGEVKITGGNTVWWGDLQIVPITKKVKSGLFSHTTVVQGYKYYLGVQYALCLGPVDALVAIQSNKKPVPFSPSGSDALTLTIDAENLFGGPTSEGGLSGKITFYRGTQTQGPNAYLSKKQTGSSIVGAYSGTGNGFLSFLAPGSGAVVETITITALSSHYTADSTKPYYGFREFSVVGSVSGSIGTAYADYSFGSSKINFTITTGSTDFTPGDHFTVTTSATRISPNYQGLCYAVLEGFYLGTSAYLKPMDFVIRRCPDPFGWGITDPRVRVGGHDANAALWIYEILADVPNGLGISPAKIDASSFQAAAVTIADEGLGISMQVDTQSTADQILSEMLRHVDGILWVDPQTSLWNITLARADYDPMTILELTVDDIQGTPEFARASWSETSNHVAITFLDRAADFNTRTVQAFESANIAATGEVRPQTIAFNGLSNSTTAALVAARVLKTLAYPISRLVLKTNRKAWNLRVGGVFKFTWIPLGINDQVFRVTRIGYGELVNGVISIDAVEDIFGLSFVSYDPAPESGWVNPTGSPVGPAFEELVELPLELVPDGVAGIYAMTLIARSDTTEKSYEVWQPIGGSDTETNEVFGFSPVAMLETLYPAGTPAKDPTGFTLQLGGLDLGVLVDTDDGGVILGANLAIFDDTGEIVSWKTATENIDGTITIAGVLRGVMDTVPRDHPVGTRVFFFSSGAGLTQVDPYPADLTVQAKILPKNNSGTFPLGSASYDTLTTVSRYLRPYPPGDLRIDGLAYGTRYSITVGDQTFTWTSRNRLTQSAGGTLVFQDAADITPEVGTTYKVFVYVAGVLVRTIDPVTTPFTYTGADRVLDGGTGNVTLLFASHANGLDSYQDQIAQIVMTGFGLDFGAYFGGINL
jgi:hypothetical protein